MLRKLVVNASAYVAGNDAAVNRHRPTVVPNAATSGCVLYDAITYDDGPILVKEVSAGGIRNKM